MRTLKPIRWKEGMFLRPQHLQQWDSFLEAREVARFQAVHSPGWGLVQLRLSPGTLDNFVFRVEALRAVLPDGTLIDVPGNAQLPARSFEAEMKEARRPLTISVGARTLVAGRPQTLPEGAGSSRFMALEADVHDVDTGADPIHVEQLDYNLRLFFGQEPTQGHDVLPVARLVQTGDSASPVALDPTFAPPCLVLAGSDALRATTRAIVERLSLTARELAQYRGGADPDPLILYQALSGCLPVLRDMVHDGQVHPRDAFWELSRLAGALYYRERTGRTADEVPAYDHRAPGPVFDRLRQLIFELSAIVLTPPYMRIKLERTGDFFRASLPQEARVPGARFFLEALAVETTPKLHLVVRGAKISSAARISTLKEHALPGVPTELLPSPPPEMPPGQTGTFFRLKTENDEWGAQALPAAELTAFVAAAPADVKLNLILVHPAG